MSFTWIWDILRSILFLIDRVVYFLIDQVYTLFIEIANTTLFTDEIIDEFAGKVYALVGVFMLFKVSFSILTYIVNPDEFADKSKGMNKLVTNILTSLLLFLAVPFIFSQAMDIQRIILRDDVIPKLFSTSDIIISGQDPGDGSHIAFITFSTFFDPPGSQTDIGELFNYDVNEKDANGNYTVEYNFIISTVVGVVMVLLLVSFCFDIAMRSIKLGFLRLLAPIPIIARVDPKKGNEVFSKWIKNCTSTYLDLFLRLAAIFFAIYIIKVIDLGTAFENVVTEANVVISGLTMVFIILGALMFAKQVPKLIEDLTGLKLSGNFSLNPLKKMEDVPLLGKSLASGARFAGRTAATLGGLGLAGAGALGGMAVHGAADRIDGLTGNRISGFGKKVGDIASGVRDAAGTRINGFLGKHENLQSAVNRVQRDLSGIGVDAQKTLYGAIGGIPGTSGLLSAAANKFDDKIKTLEEYSKFKSRLKDQSDFNTINLNHVDYDMGNSIDSEFFNKLTSGSNNAALMNAADGGVKGLKQYYEDLKNSGTASTAEVSQARELWEAAQQYIISKAGTDIKMDTGEVKTADGVAAIKAEAARYVQSHRDVLSGSDYSTSATATYKDINDAYIKSQDNIVATKSSQEYQAAQARKNGVPSSK